MLPSGSVYGFNLKIILMGLLPFFFFPYVVFKGRPIKLPALPILLTVTLLSIVAFGTVIGLTNNEVNPTHAIDQAKSFIVTIVIAWLSYFFFINKFISFKEFFIITAGANVLFAIAKLFMIYLLFTGAIGFLELVDKVKAIFDYDFVSQEISEGVIRLHLVNDSLTPFILFFTLQAKNFGVALTRTVRFSLIGIFLISIFIAFSRFLFLETFLIVLVHFLTQRSYARLLIATFFISIIVIANDELSAPLVKRFASSETSASDSIRTVEVDAIATEINKNPIIGKGLGSYTNTIIRNVASPYNYEFQWGAFMMQFGIPIFIILLASVLSIFPINVFQISSYSGTYLALTSIYLLWLLSGLTNPYMTSSTSGVIFSLFIIGRYSLLAKHDMQRAQINSPHRRN